MAEVKDGQHGTDRVAKDWAEHLKEIRDKLRKATKRT